MSAGEADGDPAKKIHAGEWKRAPGEKAIYRHPTEEPLLSRQGESATPGDSRAVTSQSLVRGADLRPESVHSLFINKVLFELGYVLLVVVSLCGTRIGKLG